ncbi:hypothetical protein KR222_009731, partial [Zaprionus bogoriensis]
VPKPENCPEFVIDCFLCPAKFTDIDELLEHLLLHCLDHTPELRAYHTKYLNCDVCGRSLRSEQELSDHHRRYHAVHLIRRDIVAGERYKCDQCGDIYVSGNFLQKHIEKAHSPQQEKVQKNAPKPHLIIPQPTPAPKMKYPPRSPFFNR